MDKALKVCPHGSQWALGACREPEDRKSANRNQLQHQGGNKEIIVHCGVGGYAACWWFVLTQVLGYENVRIFDGSIQEWGMKNHDMVPYKWE